ncbi:glycoside hydrolase family 16 protein [Chryseobacterium potabilaquae]|uniref:Beta-glucanase n=1 Tax=Chryseobacterium potabilaquae TaxID=2675057 RepID=A0A6N4XE23_9FLAO|nr:glycoside hydrolase family 16 protein [Chryseobacterium potabilaquae]CAA7197229.1 Beta-glucanase [Chryseobacterium potabilaquae]
MNVINRNNIHFLIGGALMCFTLNCISSKRNAKKQLVWSDEFNYRGLPDSKKWNYDVGGHGFGNEESQFYTQKRLENARVENGSLIIEARKENWEDSEYTSARLLTKGKFSFQYGTIEVRAKLPKGKGTWPAIWMLSENTDKWPNDGEIDIMEHVGYNQGTIHASIHTKNYNNRKVDQKTDTLKVDDASERFHIYKADWTPDHIDFYIDNIKFLSYKNEKNGEMWPFERPYFLILNVAVGGLWGGIKGIDDQVFPQKFYIDYVRIYQNK